MMKEKIVNFLGLAMRAGKVKTGESVIINEIKKHRIQLVIIAEDASENTKKVIQNKCESYHISFRIFGTRSELGQALGKAERVNVGITDQGFAKKLLSMIEEYRKE
ncbi:ribosomal L7Ae/L30e/S12e/Gadd45 family protein [Staphylococcus sp. 18_1_E_LY]|uniref:Ribosomal L7Ae/L30e/S12e/Gadd45 family protein n=1 Tax=Staphylococcus lloydii TaxID=2781774 RepID=A0A7T1AY54_9STAP|nr:ribosomal L7Ae/L30e/S12e/Gadd45 family protein [Staphylococcus lloydii]MBF7018853.1 ribosomal L7Ae/L30e/S12e/Gadd45 family protein [Staphylococcus lloydii]MBF7026581.1 ribosomal L7Ae/L30e/S12e/Gadd45 family protein [Staphylococcus lloydii]QPM74246.1 ribosomal L7Ae/L30e/S12e/Gadd45 family protein [Staphylococcus lloydii]